MQQWLSRVYASKRVGQSLGELHASCAPTWRVLSVWFVDVIGLCVCVRALRACACACVCVCVAPAGLEPVNHLLDDYSHGVVHDFDKPFENATEKAPEENAGEGDSYQIEAMR